MRELLADAAVKVALGTMAPATAHQLAKIAGRINDSFFAEVSAARLLAEQGKMVPLLGTLPMGEAREAPDAD